MRFIPYLSFNGQCAEAFRTYERVFDGRIVALTTHGEMPGADEIPPENRDRVMHAALEVEGTLLFASDWPGHMYEPPRGVSVSVNIEDVDRGERIFHALAEGGTVTMPFEKTFWAERFGMLVDRFGTPWMINCEQPA
jgi:PhnB protein